jgi:hypothetical protein
MTNRPAVASFLSANPDVSAHEVAEGADVSFNSAAVILTNMVREGLASHKATTVDGVRTVTFTAKGPTATVTATTKGAVVTIEHDGQTFEQNIGAKRLARGGRTGAVLVNDNDGDGWWLWGVKRTSTLDGSWDRRVLENMRKAGKKVIVVRFDMAAAG